MYLGEKGNSAYRLPQDHEILSDSPMSDNRDNDNAIAIEFVTFLSGMRS
jgi:hypothetical protein